MKVEGITYKSPCSVVLRVEDDYPVFGHLKGIYIVAETIVFDEHYHSYVLMDAESFETVPVKTVRSLASSLP